MSSSTPVSACRGCGAPQPLPVLDLGSTPVANRLLTSADQPSDTYPLAIGFCARCSLVQLLHELPAADIFDADYPYFSSFSDSLNEHSRSHVRDLLAGPLAHDGFVVEVASNDGYLLRHLVAEGVRVLGIEPTPGPAEAARERGVPTVEEFLDPALARAVRDEHGPADVVLANNVMAHVPDLAGFVEALALLLGDDGVLQVENPGVRWLVEHLEFDTIYHEHYCYFSTTAVQSLFRTAGLVLVDVEVFPALHGGTLRWSARRSGEPGPRVLEQLAAERGLGLTTVEPYLRFAAEVSELRRRLPEFLAGLTTDGRRLAAYGAAAKGATLLNTTGIGHDLVDFVVDRNPHKQGRWVPGARVPVLPPEALLERRPEHVLLLAWNYADEVRRQQRRYESEGGRFVVPVPQPRVLLP